MHTYWNFNKGIRQIESWEPGCWIQVTCPVEDDVRYLIEELNIPDYFIEDISDTDERARYDYDEGWLMIILRIPHLKTVTSRSPYTTVPLGILIKENKISMDVIDERVRQVLKVKFRLGLFDEPYRDEKVADKVAGCLNL